MQGFSSFSFSFSVLCSLTFPCRRKEKRKDNCTSPNKTRNKAAFNQGSMMSFLPTFWCILLKHFFLFVLDGAISYFILNNIYTGRVLSFFHFSLEEDGIQGWKKGIFQGYSDKGEGLEEISAPLNKQHWLQPRSSRMQDQRHLDNNANRSICGLATCLAPCVCLKVFITLCN